MLYYACSFRTIDVEQNAELHIRLKYTLIYCKRRRLAENEVFSPINFSPFMYGSLKTYFLFRARPKCPTLFQSITK